MERRAVVNRKTRETDIALELNLDGSGKYEIDTGIGFFDHMLSGFARHGFFDLKLKVKAGIKRYGHFLLPMDECLVLSAVDLCGRPYLSWDAEFTVPRLGDMDTEMAKEFFYAVSYAAAMNLHLKVLTPGNNHHMMEAMFKAFGKALDMAVSPESRTTEVLSTKGSL